MRNLDLDGDDSSDDLDVRCDRFLESDGETMLAVVDSGSSVNKSRPKSSNGGARDVGGAGRFVGIGSTSSKDPNKSVSVRCRPRVEQLAGGSKKISPGFETGAEWKSPKSEEDEWWCPCGLFAVGLREGLNCCWLDIIAAVVDPVEA